MLEKRSGPWRITFDTNPDMCNINCIMCEEHSEFNINKQHQNRLMDFQIIKQIIKDTIPYGLKEIIPSTMGEPLLYPEFENLIRLLEKYDLKLNLTTNGTFPRYGVEYWGPLILSIASDVKISINGASKNLNEKIMKGINFEKQLENIQKIISLRDAIRKPGEEWPAITFQATFLESNLNELPELLKLAIKLNADRFKGHHLWITHPQLESESLKRNEMAIKKWNRVVNKMNSIVKNNLLKNGNQIIIDNIYPIDYKNGKYIPQGNYICPFLGREAWIAWDGTFNVCCAPDDLRKTLGTFGNVKTSKFMNLWNSKKYSQLVNDWDCYDICKMCNMRKPMEEIRGCKIE